MKVGTRVIFKTHPAKDVSKHIGDMQAVVIGGEICYSRGAIVRNSEIESNHNAGRFVDRALDGGR